MTIATADDISRLVSKLSRLQRENAELQADKDQRIADHMRILQRAATLETKLAAAEADARRFKALEFAPHSILQYRSDRTLRGLADELIQKRADIDATRAYLQSCLD